MDGRPTWTDCDEAGDYVVPTVLRICFSSLSFLLVLSITSIHGNAIRKDHSAMEST